MGFTKFETDIIEKILAGDGKSYPILKEQFKVAKVKERRFSGVGFFLYFDLLKDVRLLEQPASFFCSHVAVQCRELKHGASFVLFINEGKIQMFEGVTFDEPWPATITGYILNYIPHSGVVIKDTDLTRH